MTHSEPNAKQPIAGAFDPYHQWLGIPPEQQPPDHYALLGLKRRFLATSGISQTVYFVSQSTLLIQL